MKLLAVAPLIALLLTAQAHAADPDLSVDAKRMLAYGSLAVMTGACKTDLTPGQAAQMNKGLEQAANAQKQLTEAQFTEIMKSVGAQVGENKDQVCASLTPEYIDASLQQAAVGE